MSTPPVQRFSEIWKRNNTCRCESRSFCAFHHAQRKQVVRAEDEEGEGEDEDEGAVAEQQGSQILTLT